VEGAEELGGDECGEVSAGFEPREGALKEEGGEVGLCAEVGGDAFLGGVGPEVARGGGVEAVESFARGWVDAFSADPGGICDDEVKAAAREDGGEARLPDDGVCARGGEV
jgi:hypothetical protein